jgi:hypothetical protein
VSGFCFVFFVFFVFVFCRLFCFWRVRVRVRVLVDARTVSGCFVCRVVPLVMPCECYSLVVDKCSFSRRHSCLSRGSASDKTITMRLGDPKKSPKGSNYCSTLMSGGEIAIIASTDYFASNTSGTCARVNGQSLCARLVLPVHRSVCHGSLVVCWWNEIPGCSLGSCTVVLFGVFRV